MSPSASSSSVRPCRVAYVVATAGTTGVERHLEVLLGALDRRLVAPVLFAPGPGPLVDRARALGVAVEFGAPTRKLAWRDASRLRRRLADRFDIVHAHGPRAAFWTARAARQARIPFVATIHELRWTTLPSGPRRALWVLLEDMSLHDSTHLIAVSEVVRDAVLARHPGWRARMTVVHGSTPLLAGAGPHEPRDSTAVGEPLSIVTVGRLDWVKGTDLVLDAFARLKGAGVRFEAHLVGDGPLRGGLRAQAERLGLGGMLHWHHGAADVRGLLRRADLFVTGTRFETFGMAVLEAIASGVPVVAPRVGAIEEVAGDDSGLLVDAEPRAGLGSRLADALERLAADPELRARLGASGRARALARFAPASLAEGVTDVYARVLGRPSRRSGDRVVPE